jgi:hypothetical protein
MKNSPYLDRPLLPLAVALPRMLQEVETKLAAAGLAETDHLRQEPNSSAGCSLRGNRPIR